MRIKNLDLNLINSNAIYTIKLNTKSYILSMWLFAFNLNIKVNLCSRILFKKYYENYNCIFYWQNNICDI